MKKKILAVVLAAMMAVSTCAVSAAAEENTAEKDSDSIVVLFTNDVHCNIDHVEKYAEPVEDTETETETETDTSTSTDSSDTESDTDKIVYGDVTGDGLVKMEDVVEVQKHIAKLITLEGKALTAANVVLDEEVNMLDVTTMQKFIAELIKELPVEVYTVGELVDSEPDSEDTNTEADTASEADTSSETASEADTATEEEKVLESAQFGYAGVAAYKKAMQKEYDNVVLVDIGDHVQGGAVGALSKGENIIKIMNAVPYDLATLGNHEFDYAIPRLRELTDMATYKYVSSNFVALEKDSDGNDASHSVYDAYEIKELGGKKVAFVGVTTPESFTKSTPSYFKNEEGEYIYGFCQGNDGADLYANVQASVDAAIAEGAEIVVGMGHLGDDEESKPWTSAEVIANTTGIDAFLDGHSHHLYTTDVENKDGEKVTLAQTGTALANLGKLIIDGEGTVTAEMIDAKDFLEVDEDTQKVVDEINESLAEKLNSVIAKSRYDLVINDPESSNRIVRSAETNLGDLCADAYRDLTGADIAFVNGGGVRKDIKAGDITFQNVIDVHPFGNMACMIEVTGQQIADALELGAIACPGESGGFLQVSGLTYTIDTTIESTVKLSEEKEFIEVEGARRVKDIKVGEEDLDLTKTYTLASHNYMLKNGGDGYTMFKGSKILLDEIKIDNEVLMDYIQKIVDEEHYLPDTYKNPYGLGRITIIDGSEDGDDYIAKVKLSEDINWEKVYIYGWVDQGAEVMKDAGKEFPGIEMTKGEDGVYTADLSDFSTINRVIISDGNNKKTEDLVFSFGSVLEVDNDDLYIEHV